MSESEHEDPFACDSDGDAEYRPSVSEYSSDDDFPENGRPVSVLNSDIVDNDNSGRKKKRKRTRDPSQWAAVVRKQKRNSGNAYMSSRKKLMPAKAVKNFKNCQTSCRLKCSEAIKDDDRQAIFKAYYTLSKEGKKLFLIANSKKVEPSRRRKGKNQTNSRKLSTFHYCFNINSKIVQVCNSFFLGTLNISQKSIYNVHKTKNTVANTPAKSVHGIHAKHRISEELKNKVRAHIDSIPKIDSHYCRADSQRQYVESGLNIKILYENYKEQMISQNELPVKESQYRFIFCTKYNIFFQLPKKDRCDTCELGKLRNEENQEIEDDVKQKYETHISEKIACRKERNRDRESNTAVLSFYMQNVLTCPKAEVSKFFYKSKLSVYNLTAHLSVDKQVYCAFWNEHLVGRKGNDIASALYEILLKVLDDNPYLNQLTLWSDSCVAQNRISMLSFSITKLLWEKKDTPLENITIKYYVPGHSCVQEVDATHSAIERILNRCEYYSPLSLLRVLLKVNRRKPYKIIQMKTTQFKNFQDCSSLLKYDQIPFTKLTEIQFSKSHPEIVSFKTSYSQDAYTEVEIEINRKVKNLLERTLKTATGNVTLPQNKVEALQFMLPWMPQIDQQYYKTFLPQDKQKKKRRRTK